MYLCRQIVETNIILMNTNINNKIMMNRKLTFGGMLMAALALGMPMNAHAAKKAAKQNFAGYLFAYFEGSGNKQEHLRFAISEDAKNWYALNDNQPVIASDSISTSGGIRDPHILRGEDGCYYIVATDMNTVKNGWKDNPGIVLMKSKDLVNWTHSKIVLKEDYKEHFSDAYWVWAPQTIYDKKAKKYMIYFTLQRTGDGRKSLVTYYAYANKDFTGFESEPKVLFNAKYGCIDNDIIERNGVYHMFYKGNIKNAEGKEIQNGIQQATAKNLKGPWKEDFKFIDAYADSKTGVEGSGVFKLNDKDEYVLMYDLYGSGRYEYQTSKDLNTFSTKPESFRKDFFPRHGTVCSVTKDEMERLQQKWGYVLKHDFVATGNPVFSHIYTADPAVLVDKDTLWLFAGHDAKGNHPSYEMHDWKVFSTTDMKHWTQYPTPLMVSDFKWAKSKQAYAGHVVERNGKYYWYVSTNWCGIGVAVSDKITGPYKDALGKPLLTNKDCFDSKHRWACIDPAIFIDDDNTPYIIWGNGQCYIAKLKDNMVEIDGEIKRIDVGTEFPFTEAPWVHKYGKKYYLSYASGWPEKIAYAMADNIMGPWTAKGIISEIAGNSNTTHPAIVNYNDQWLFFSHNGALHDGGSYKRSVIIEPMAYNADGTIRPIAPTTKGASGLGNPILPGFHADPEILYSNKTGKYYIYSTTDGKPGWGGYKYYVYSSSDLKEWKNEGVALDAKSDQISWANGNLWAPAAVEVKQKNGSYKYYLYFSARPNDNGRKQMGVAVSDSPTGPFVDLGHPLLAKNHPGCNGQLIDVDVFIDPVSKKPYLYWGNGFMAGAELEPSMTQIKDETVTVMTPKGGSLRDYAYREAPYVFYRNGLYYFMWSVDDTGAANYHVAYGTSKSPLGPIEVAKDPIVLIQDPQHEIYGTAHNSVIQKPGTDEWYIVYHRINKDYIHFQPGVHREVCIDKLEFNADGTIKRVVPTHKGI